MNDAIQMAVGAPAFSEISRFDPTPLETGKADPVVQAECTIVRESLSEIFVDEIDAWARRALAANGFGDAT